MKQIEITQNHYDLIFALFQTSALVDTLDNMDTNSLVVRDLKQQTNKYKKFLYKKILPIFNSMYDVDAEEFEVMDRCITRNAEEFANKGFKEFFKIID